MTRGRHSVVRSATRALILSIGGLLTAVLPAAIRPLAAQTLLLQLRPHAGDTLRMRLDQESEMTGVRRTVNGETSAMVMSTMSVFSRAIVEREIDRGSFTQLLAITDSVRLATSDERARAAAVAAESQLRGQRVEFHVAPDGTVGVPSAAGVSRDVAQVASLMPAAFPKTPIAVGDSWAREMALPAGLQLGAQLSGKLRVLFRLDSLTHNGDWAFISMRGEVRPATGPGAASDAVLEKGLVNGTMLMDQKRGWLTESSFNITVTSIMTPPPSSGVLSMHMQMRITQHMHTMERR